MAMTSTKWLRYKYKIDANGSYLSRHEQNIKAFRRTAGDLKMPYAMNTSLHRTAVKLDMAVPWSFSARHW